MNIKTLIARIAVLAIVAFAFAPAAHATTVLPLYLEEIVDTSAIAFEGTCVGNRTERDPQTNLVVTYTTFQVREALKGSAAGTYTIKQVGGQLPDGGMQFRVEGVPSFSEGESYVVFLAGVSSAGFSSPIGLMQGRFKIHGNRVANGRDFRDMTARIPDRVPAGARAQLQKATGIVRDMDLVDFKQTVRNHMGAAR